MTSSDRERFFAKVDRGPGHGPWGDCHLWTAYCLPNGYGQFSMGRAEGMKVAHRLAYAMKHGPPGKLKVLHRCDVRACVNPHHLFLGTQQDNLADMRAKGRQVRGTAVGGAKLTEDAVAAIRRRCAAGERQRDLAEEYGVAQSAISMATTGRNWSHVP